MCPAKEPRPHAPLCGAPNKRGNGTCKQTAGSRTDHPGQGRCWLHGGRSPIKHGRYSTITRPRIKELLAQLEDDPDPMDLLPEVRLLRALVMDYVERYDKLTEAVLDWHESWRKSAEMAKPRQVPDILSVGKFIADIGGLVDKIQRGRQEGAISMAAFVRVTDQMGLEMIGAVQEVVPDADTVAKLLQLVDERWASIQVEAHRPGAARSEGSTQGA